MPESAPATEVAVPLMIAGRRPPASPSCRCARRGTQSTAAMVAQAGPADVEAALAAAHGALAETAALPRARRAAILAELATRVGGPLRRARRPAALRRPARPSARRASRSHGPRRPCGSRPRPRRGSSARCCRSTRCRAPTAGSGITVAEPVGVVAAIPAYNFPLLIAAHKLGPAIGAGCPCVIKPPEQTPLAILALATRGDRRRLAGGGAERAARAGGGRPRTDRGPPRRADLVHRLVGRRAARLPPVGPEAADARAGIERRDDRARGRRPRPRDRALRRRRVLRGRPVVHLGAARVRRPRRGTPSCSSASRPGSARCAPAIRTSRRPTSAPSSTTRRPSGSRP